MDEDKIHRLARKKVKKKKGFYWHLQVYVLINFAITMITFFEGSPGENFPMPILWGVALAFHYVAVFGMPGGKMSDEWEEKEFQKEYTKMQRRYDGSTLDKKERRVELPKTEVDMDEYLDLKEPRKMREYDENDFV